MLSRVQRRGLAGDTLDCAGGRVCVRSYANGGDSFKKSEGQPSIGKAEVVNEETNHLRIRGLVVRPTVRTEGICWLASGERLKFLQFAS
jgi:hypothetical protein